MELKTNNQPGSSWLANIYHPIILGRFKDDPGPLKTESITKILVVRNDNIGDVLCTTPAIDALRERFPRAYIAALVCTLAEEAITGHRALDKVYAYPKAKHRHYGPLESLLRLAGILSEIRKEKFDLAVAFRADFSPSQGWLTYASRSRWRLGPRAEGKKKRWGFYYNLAVPPPPAGIHEVQRCFHYLAHLGLTDAPGELSLSLTDQALGRAEEFLTAHGFTPERPPIVLNMTSTAYRPDRNWPVENYRRLTEKLRQRPEGLVLSHDPGSRDWVTELVTTLTIPPPVFCSPSLKDFAALAARAKVFVTAEGGPMHVAAAVGAPLVVLWGTNDPAVWHPWGVPYKLVGSKRPVKEIHWSDASRAVDELVSELVPV